MERILELRRRAARRMTELSEKGIAGRKARAENARERKGRLETWIHSGEPKSPKEVEELVKK